jgi:hypothetical protein
MRRRDLVVIRAVGFVCLAGGSKSAEAPVPMVPIVERSTLTDTEGNVCKTVRLVRDA